MAKVLVTESNLTDIGDAIRDRLLVGTQYLPSEMGDAVRSIRVIDIDPTLTHSGYAADAKAVGDRFDNLIDPGLSSSGMAADAKVTGAMIRDTQKSVSDVADAVNVSVIEDFVPRQYIQTNGNIGTTVAINSPQTSSNFAYNVVNVSVGDKITLNATGGNAGRLWAFLDSSNALLSKADANAVASNLVLTAPANAAKLVLNVNLNATIGANYIGTSVDSRIAGNVDATLSISGKAADAKVTGDNIAKLNRIVPVEDFKWTLGSGIDPSGEKYPTNFLAITDKIAVRNDGIFYRTGQTIDANGKFLVYYVCEYSGETFVRRTEMTADVESVAFQPETTEVIICFGRYTSSETTITQNDLSTYFGGEIIESGVSINELQNYIKSAPVFAGNDVDTILQNSVLYAGEGKANLPTATGGYFVITALYDSRNTAAAIQIAIRFDSGITYVRRRASNSWRSWHCVSRHSAPSTPLYYAFGDSLMWGAVWTDSSESPHYAITQASKNNQIPTRIANAIGAAGGFGNNAVGGAYFVGSGANTIKNQITSQNLANAKIITVAGGRNDSENALGTRNATAGDGTICGAIEEILQYIETNYKKLQVVWIGVTPNTNNNETVFTKTTSGGWSLNSFDEEVSALCEKHCVPYVSWKQCTYMRHWADFSGAANVYSHPNNEESYLQMGNYIAGKVSGFYVG